jgi:hypothetical protein
MNLTDIIRKLEGQLRNAEKISKQYDKQADILRNKLGEIAVVVGKRIKGVGGQIAKAGNGAISAKGRAKIAAAQKKRWAAFRKKKGKSGRKK